MTTKVDGVDARVKTLEETIVDKADDADLTAAVERLTTAEAAVAANTAKLNSFVAMSEGEIRGYFAAQA